MDLVSGCKFHSNAEAVVAALTWSHKESKALLDFEMKCFLPPLLPYLLACLLLKVYFLFST